MGGKTGGVFIYNINTSLVSQVGSTGMNGQVYGLALISASLLAAASSDRMLAVINYTSYSVVSSFTTSHTTTIYACIAVPSYNSPINNLVLTASGDATVKVWDVSNNNQMSLSFTGHTQTVRCLAKLSNGFVASGSNDNYVKVWNYTSGVVQLTMTHSDDVVSLTQSSTNTLAAGDMSNVIKIWNITNGVLITTLTGTSGNPWFLKALSSDRIVTGDSFSYSSIYNWPASNSVAAQTAYISSSADLTGIDMSSSSTLIQAFGVGGYKQIRIYRITSYTFSSTFSSIVPSQEPYAILALSPYNSELIVTFYFDESF